MHGLFGPDPLGIGRIADDEIEAFILTPMNFAKAYLCGPTENGLKIGLSKERISLCEYIICGF